MVRGRRTLNCLVKNGLVHPKSLVFGAHYACEHSDLETLHLVLGAPNYSDSEDRLDLVLTAILKQNLPIIKHVFFGAFLIPLMVQSS